MLILDKKALLKTFEWLDSQLDTVFGKDLKEPNQSEFGTQFLSLIEKDMNDEFLSVIEIA